MPKSRNRKDHKKKSARRTQSLLVKRAQTISLVKELEEQLKIIRENPITGVDITPSEAVTLTPFTGTLPAQDINITL